MATLGFTIVSNRPIEEVFAFVCNPENYPKWFLDPVLQITPQTAKLGRIMLQKEGAQRRR
jgi:uncharacterized protein YndB with AHSA1/START domain